MTQPRDGCVLNPVAYVNSETAVGCVYGKVQSESMIYRGRYKRDHRAYILGTSLSYLFVSSHLSLK